MLKTFKIVLFPRFRFYGKEDAIIVTTFSDGKRRARKAMKQTEWMRTHFVLKVVEA